MTGGNERRKQRRKIGGWRVDLRHRGSTSSVIRGPEVEYWSANNASWKIWWWEDEAVLS